jgi:hypothetical protein
MSKKIVWGRTAYAFFTKVQQGVQAHIDLRSRPAGQRAGYVFLWRARGPVPASPQSVNLADD